MRPGVIGGIAAGLGVLWLVSSARAPAAGGYSYGGAPLKEGLDRDPARLLPGFARKLELLFQRMRARGFDPILWEGARTDARARYLAEIGTGIYPSLHMVGAAGDILDRKLLWKAPQAFWTALGQEAARLGLTWGGTWKSADLPHVQAIPFSAQTRFFAMSPSARAAFVA